MNHGEANHQPQGPGEGSAGFHRVDDHGRETESTFESPDRGSGFGNVRPYVAEFDQLVEMYRTGRRTLFEVISGVTNFLSQDNELTRQQRSQAFDLYMAEVEAAKPVEPRSGSG